MTINEIRTIQDVLLFLQKAIAEEREGRFPADIAWDITDLMGLPNLDVLQEKYPVLEKILDASADLEVTEKVGYEPIGILWHRIKDLTEELSNQINAG